MRRDVYQAIADPVRRDIIDLLTKETLTVMQIAERFNITRPGISKHLNILKECGIIEIDKIGREQFCQIKTESLVPAFMWLEKFKKEWTDRIDSFENYLEEIQTKNKKHDGKNK